MTLIFFKYNERKLVRKTIMTTVLSVWHLQLFIIFLI